MTFQGDPDCLHCVMLNAIAEFYGDEPVDLTEVLAMTSKVLGEMIVVAARRSTEPVTHAELLQEAVEIALAAMARWADDTTRDDLQ